MTTKTRLQTVVERLADDLDAELAGDDFSGSFSMPGFNQPSSEDWTPTQKQIEIVRILKETPMLTDWALRRLRELQARITMATLNEMYSPDELQALREAMLEDS